ncbi:hypothetical protein IMSAGC016_00847 [Muribaculaceae bacterium]|nr:hypothetical protein IMSAGC016_00847 [Muribaculaceae bacterium]
MIENMIPKKYNNELMFTNIDKKLEIFTPAE